MQSQTYHSAAEIAHESEATASDYFALLKPRVMALVVFTGLCGLLMPQEQIHPILGFTAILCIAVGAGAAGCLNMWYDRDIDAIMTRTKTRPIPQGRISPDNALAFGLILSAGSVMILGVAINWLAAALLAFTIVFYVAIYTMWLKRWTPQNIVIGGAAGALPPVIGWAAASNSTPLEAWLLFAIIFLWTPPHFWALSLHRHEDYYKAQVPMLPITAGIQATKVQILLYSVLLTLTVMVPYWIDMATLFYGITALVLNVGFIVLAYQVYRASTTNVAMRLFGYSISYLFMIFLSLTIDHLCLR
jgi:heme o synthase